MLSGNISERNTRLYIVTQFLHSLVFTIPIWIAYYQLHLTTAQISYLVAFQYVIQVVGELPTGALADLLGKRLTMLASFLFGAAGLLFLPFASSFAHFLVLAAITGVADAFMSGSLEALVYDSLKQDGKEKEFAAVVAKQNVWYQIGLIISTVLGGFLYQFSQTLPFVLYGLSQLIAFGFSFFFIEPTVDSEVFTLKNYLLQMKMGAHEAFKNTETKMLSLYYISVGAITWTTILYFSSVLLIDLGFADTQRGIISALIRVFNMTLLLKLLQNKRIFSKRNTMFFFPIVMLIAYLPGIFLQHWWGVPFLAAAMMAGTARWTILAPHTNEAFSSKYRATAISMLSLLIGVVYIFTTALSGPIMENFGGVRTMFTVLGILTALTVVPLTFLMQRKGMLNAVAS